MGDSTEVKEQYVMNREEEAWVCRQCGIEGPYAFNPPRPRGWKFTLRDGLVCSKCARLLGIKKSDEVEQKQNKKENENNWNIL